MSSEQIIEGIRKLCALSGIEFESLLRQAYADLEIRIRQLFIPNKEWFDEGKSFPRYLNYLNTVTGHTWDPNEALKWFKLVRYPSETRKEIPASLRYEVLERDRYTCQKCGRKAPDVELHIDHKLPWAFGGPTVIDTLQALCSECNEGKSNKYVT